MLAIWWLAYVRLLGFRHPCVACDFWAGPCGSLLLLESVLRLVSVLFELLVLRVLSSAFAGFSIRQIRRVLFGQKA